ncbi:hypothetical protein ElyMa_006755200 [Elysia marginata]|uniref:Fibrinogen C-terminal domain-containing protein n=1 Tax=Elysia marginata TaxID=1093978 RepID=A0AAV4J030_9GAST|nr:hypothetical protein ElyMa_006755200 [Elysia marginata]
MASIGLMICVLLMMCFHSCEGFDFTINHQVSNLSSVSDVRQVCGVLQCSERIPRQPSDQGNNFRKLTSLAVYKNHVRGYYSSSDRWEMLASMTSQHRALSRVSDGMQISGELSDLQAQLSLKLTKPLDCRQSQFLCMAVFVDSQGWKSVKKSLIGEAVGSHPDFDIQVQSAQSSVHETKVSDSETGSALTIAHLVDSVQMRLDRVESRLEDSLKSLENRLKDKVGNSQMTINNRIGEVDGTVLGKFEALGGRMNNLENRLEDKIGNLHNRVLQALGDTKKTNSGDGDVPTLLASKLDALENTLKINTEHLENYVNKQIESTDTIKQFSNQLVPVMKSVQSIEKNLTSFNTFINTQTTTNQLAAVSKTENAMLRTLVSDVTSLSNVTQSLSSKLDVLKKAYAGGALLPVEEFSDPLGVGTKVWRLVFRGTAYNDIPLYPAYLHGTRVPIDVEEGCKQFNKSLPCVNYYRNREALDEWSGVDEILFAIYKDNQMVKKIIFNGKDSTYTNWFAADRVIHSSWADLKTQPHNFFSMKGFFTQPGHVRRWYINREHRGSCNGFNGWFYVRDDVANVCSADTTAARPLFQYATGNTYSVWTSQEVARADAFGVFLKYELSK